MNMPISRMMMQEDLRILEEETGERYPKRTMEKILTRLIDGLGVTEGEWKRVLSLAKTKTPPGKLPGIVRLEDAARAIRGGERGEGTRYPPKASGRCETCKGAGVLWVYRGEHRSVVLCTCDNADRTRFMLTHHLDRRKDPPEWVPNHGPDPKSVKTYIEEGGDPKTVEDANHCRVMIGETYDQRILRAYERVLETARRGGWVPRNVRERIIARGLATADDFLPADSTRQDPPDPGEGFLDEPPTKPRTEEELPPPPF